ncbi:Cytochrome b, partial [Atta colombica]
NFGSLVDIFLLIQIIRGLFLSIHYCPNISIAFNRIISGVTIFLLSIATAFLGMNSLEEISLWGATVITNLISTIPYIGYEYYIYFSLIILQFPYIFRVPDNSTPANRSDTHIHI